MSDELTSLADESRAVASIARRSRSLVDSIGRLLPADPLADDTADAAASKGQRLLRDAARELATAHALRAAAVIQLAAAELGSPAATPLHTATLVDLVRSAL